MKSKLFSWILGISVALMAYQAWAENVQISTYYPSPYGSYTQLDAVTLNVTGNTTIAGSATITGAVTGGSFATLGTINGASVTATGAVNAASVTATGAVTGATLSTGGMTVTATPAAGSNHLRVRQVGADYYCYAVYA